MAWCGHVVYAVSILSRLNEARAPQSQTQLEAFMWFQSSLASMRREHPTRFAAIADAKIVSILSRLNEARARRSISASACTFAFQSSLASMRREHVTVGA